jgi:hypothetical protein
MTQFDTVVGHVNQGVTYSWDLTVLVGLGIVIPDRLRETLLRSRTTTEDAALLTSIYTGNLLRQRKSDPALELTGEGPVVVARVLAFPGAEGRGVAAPDINACGGLSDSGRRPTVGQHGIIDL